MNTFEKLEELARINDFLATYESSKNDTKSLLDAEKQRLIDSILTPELLAKVEEINAEFKPKYDLLESDEPYVKNKKLVDELTAQIKAEVIENGSTIKGSVLQGVFTKGRYLYSDDPKSGYEQVMVYRKLGDPSVSIRKVAA